MDGSITIAAAVDILTQRQCDAYSALVYARDHRDATIAIHIEREIKALGLAIDSLRADLTRTGHAEVEAK